MDLEVGILDSTFFVEYVRQRYYNFFMLQLLQRGFLAKDLTGANSFLAIDGFYLCGKGDDKIREI